MSALNSAKLSAQSPPCSRNPSPRETCASLAFRDARLTCKNQRRIASQTRLNCICRAVASCVIRHLYPLFSAPIRFFPTPRSSRLSLVRVCQGPCLPMTTFRTLASTTDDAAMGPNQCESRTGKNYRYVSVKCLVREKHFLQV